MKNETFIATGSRFFPKVGCHIFFPLKSIDQKEIFTGLCSFFPRICFFLPLWKCSLEDKSSLGNRTERAISVLLLTVHRLLLYQEEFSHHLCITTASFFFLYPHGLKIKGGLTRGCPACAYSGTVLLCSV